MRTPYPANPQYVPESITDASPTFKREVKKVLIAIILFFLVYLILMAFSIILSVACIYIGIAIMGGLRSIIGILAGLGVISIGIMVFVFLVKFIFSVKKYDEEGTVEITEQDQPLLFEFIRQLTKDTQTPFPKRIILSPEVNAAVFYNDSFWSMIFPVKKNLQIGVALINTLTLSEFKAVMAHEFGHFSQRSMKLGSFVYNVNKVIYNMLYDNKGFANFLNGWGNLHWAIGIFVQVTIAIVKGIQKVLQEMYGYINKAYMSLSREMEFHADAVAASVSGADNMITALRKTEISNLCYNTVLQKADDYLKEKTFFKNIYHEHNIVMRHYAREFKLPVVNDVPVASESFYKNFQQSRINIKDQWASHPSREDREANLSSLNVNAPADNRPAWELFDNPELLQEQLSAIIYRNVPASEKEKCTDDATFEQKYIEEQNIFIYPEEYKGYYDNRSVSEINMEKVFGNAVDIVIDQKNIDTLFSDEKISLPKKLLVNMSDAGLLEAIANKESDIKTFDYNGEKYNKADASSLLETLNAEMKQQQEQLLADDEDVVAYFYKVALLNGEEQAAMLKEKYQIHFNNRKQVEEYIQYGTTVVNLLSPLFAGQQVSLQEAEKMADGLRDETQKMKALLGAWVDKGFFKNNPMLKESIERFIGAHYTYFNSPSFIDPELEHLHKLTHETVREMNIYQSISFKDIVEFQLSLFNKIISQRA